MASSIDSIISPVPKTTTQSPVKVLKFIAFTFAPHWCFSPSGSLKNRLALVEIEDAERTGKAQTGSDFAVRGYSQDWQLVHQVFWEISF
jgi:cysteine synthase